MTPENGNDERRLSSLADRNIFRLEDVMAVQTVQDAFKEFEKQSVRVPAWQNDRAKEVHPEIRAAVEADLGDLFIRAYLAGSYARRVQTAPKLKDIDIIVVMADPDGVFAASADAALERLRKAAKDCDLVDGTRKGIRAVKLDIDGEEFTVDLVGALNDVFGEVKLARRLPEENLDDWTSARPKAQLDAASKKNSDTNGIYVPAVRIVKYWNQYAGVGGKNVVPSYLAESILYHAIPGEADYADVVLAFFRDAKTHLSISGPTVTCPGDSTNYVDERLDEKRREEALKKVERALGHAEDAVAESDPGKAMDLWVKVFGPAFPAPTGDTSSLATALTSGSAVAKGTGISTSSDGGRQVIPTRPYRAQ